MTSRVRYIPTSDMIKWGWMRKKVPHPHPQLQHRFCALTPALLLQGSERRNWSDRWVILSKSGEMKYYKTPQDTTCQGSLNVIEYTVADSAEWERKYSYHP